jgi:hypothetical protein
MAASPPARRSAGEAAKVGCPPNSAGPVRDPQGPLRGPERPSFGELAKIEIRSHGAGSDQTLAIKTARRRPRQDRRTGARSSSTFVTSASMTARAYPHRSCSIAFSLAILPRIAMRATAICPWPGRRVRKAPGKLWKGGAGEPGSPQLTRTPRGTRTATSAR